MKTNLKRKLTILSLFCLSLIWACAGTKGSDLKTIQGNPEALYKQGLALFNKRDYEDAKKKFEELKSSFPDSPPFTVWAELKMADSQFLLRNYVEAIAAYEEFKKVHPSHEEMPYVQYQIGLAYYNQMLTPDRDQTSSAKALSAFEYLVATYPPSLFTEKAKEKIDVCKSRLAGHEFCIGDYYYQREKYQAAAARFEGLLEKYPGMEGEDHTLLLLAKSYLELEQVEKARQRLNQLVTRYEKSPYAKEARVILERGQIPKAAKESSRKGETKGKKESEPSGGLEVNSIPLVKFEEEGRKPVSLTDAVTREPSQTVSSIEKPKAVSSSSSGVPALAGRTKPAPFSSPSKAATGAKAEEVKQASSFSGLPVAPSGGKEKSGEMALPVWKQEKGDEPAQPIEITSDRVETYTNDNLIVFKGNVVARQKDMTIYADSIDALLAGEGQGIEKVIAGGNVKITQGVRTAQSQKAVFNNIEKKVVLTGEPKVWEGEQLISGDEIVFDMDRNRIEVKGGSGGRGKAKVYPKAESERKE
jgi:outer membrane protein assembly factor BamD